MGESVEGLRDGRAGQERSEIEKWTLRPPQALFNIALMTGAHFPCMRCSRRLHDLATSPTFAHFFPHASPASGGGAKTAGRRASITFTAQSEHPISLTLLRHFKPTVSQSLSRRQTDNQRQDTGPQLLSVGIDSALHTLVCEREVEKPV